MSVAMRDPKYESRDLILDANSAQIGGSVKEVPRKKIFMDPQPQSMVDEYLYSPSIDVGARKLLLRLPGPPLIRDPVRVKRQLPLWGAEITLIWLHQPQELHQTFPPFLWLHCRVFPALTHDSCEALAHWWPSVAGEFTDIR